MRKLPLCQCLQLIVSMHLCLLKGKRRTMLTSCKQGCLTNFLLSLCGQEIQIDLGKPKFPGAISLLINTIHISLAEQLHPHIPQQLIYTGILPLIVEVTFSHPD